jgi:hypothetical protein
MKQHTLRFRPTIQQRFEAFHAENPQVFTWFRRFASELLDAGHERLSADMLMHRVRFEVARHWAKSDGWKINNDLVASYARELMKEPRFANVFETRRRKAS